MPARHLALLVAVLFSTVTAAHAQTYLFRQTVPGLKPHIAAPAEPETPSEPQEPGEPGEGGFSMDQLVATPSTLNLPATEAGMPVALTAVVQNHNAQTVNITNLYTSSSQVEATGDCLGATLANGQSCSFEARIPATEPVNHTGRYVFLETSYGTKLVNLGPVIVTERAYSRAKLTTPQGNSFGNLEVGSSVTRTVTLQNIGTQPATGVFLSVSPFAGFSTVSNDCGTAGSPITLNRNATCNATFAWQPTEEGGLSVRIVANGSFENTEESTFTGTAGEFNAAGSWSSAANTVVAPDAEYRYIATLAPDTTAKRTFWLRNTGTHGAMHVAFEMSGDVSQFRILDMYKNKGSSLYPCNTWTQAQPCRADNKESTGRPDIRFDVEYRPTETGTHSVTITPIGVNGAAMPAPLVVSGEAVFDAQGQWDDINDLMFGSTTPGATKTRKLVIKNVGTYGAMHLAFELTGDTEHFKLQKMSKTRGTGITSPCSSWTTSSPCKADNKESTGRPDIEFEVVYMPQSPGVHGVTITPIAVNDAIAPEPISVGGVAVFDAQGVWSTKATSAAPPAYESLDFGPTAVGTNGATEPIYLVNTGTHGKLLARFTLEGPDADQFRVTSIDRVQHTGPQPCSSSNFSTPCAVDDVDGGLRPHIRIQVQYRPTRQGPHSAELVAISENGAVVPAAFPLTGNTN